LIAGLKLILSAAILASLLCSRSALVGGWYLMEPPNEADLDAIFRVEAWPEWHDYLTAPRTSVMPSKVRFRLCARQFFVFVPKAPVFSA
jgi:hypothetical protein